MLEKLADSFVHVVDRGQRLETSNYLNALTKPFAKLIVQVKKHFGELRQFSLQARKVTVGDISELPL